MKRYEAKIVESHYQYAHAKPIMSLRAPDGHVTALKEGIYEAGFRDGDAVTIMPTDYVVEMERSGSEILKLATKRALDAMEQEVAKVMGTQRASSFRMDAEKALSL